VGGEPDGGEVVRGPNVAHGDKMSRTSSRLTASIFLACGFAVSIASCRGGGAHVSASSTSGGAGGGSDGSGGAGASNNSYATSACGTCVQKACATQWGTCASDPGCAAYLDCLSACAVGSNGDADKACDDACPAISDSAGQMAKTALDECRSMGSGAMCTPCGELPVPTDPIYHQVCGPPPASDALHPCWLCEDEHCCDTYAKCHDDSACVDLVMCVQNCADASSDMQTIHDCWHQCYAMQPASAFPELGDKLSCLGYFCISECAMPNDPPCDDCKELYCADEIAACGRDLQCTLLSDCEYPCQQDGSCYAACEAMFPQSSVDLMHAQTDCEMQYCTLQCDGTGP
jgi:hypothetical protein